MVNCSGTAFHGKKTATAFVVVIAIFVVVVVFIVVFAVVDILTSTEKLV